MSPERLEVVRGWLAKSRSDLAAARLLISGEDRLLDTGVFHCQQTAEKVLKAFLASNGVIPPKTHDLVALLDTAVTFNKDLVSLRESMALLNPLGVQFRYPGDLFEPTNSEASRALHLANEVFAFVSAALTRLASEESPPSVS